MSSATSSPTPQTPAGFNPWLVAVTVTIATFMEVLDSTIANVALPHIAGDLGVSVDEASWILTTYLLANAVVLPISGWASGLIGRKRFYMTCVFLFTCSSVLCGLAPNLGWLLFFRLMQGAGGGGLQPSEQGILLDTFPPQKRGMAMAVYGIAVLLAPILGPTLGGYVTDHCNWRWIFFINIPVGCLSLFLTNLVVKDPAYLDAERRARAGKPLNLDLCGLGLIAVGLGALEIVYDHGQENDWTNSRFILVLMVLAIVCLSTAFVWEWRHPHPIVNVRLLMDRNFGMGCLVIYAVFAALYGSNILLPQMLQEVFTYDAFKAGLIMSPGGIGVMICMPIGGYLLGRGVDGRYLIFFGTLCVAVFSMWAAYLNLEVSPEILIFARCAQLFGMGFVFAPLNTVAYMYLPREQGSNATGLFNLVRNEGSSLGITLVNIMLARRGQFHQSRLTEGLTPFNMRLGRWQSQLAAQSQAAGYDPATAGKQAMASIYHTVQQQAQAMSYFDLYWMFALVIFCAAPLVFLMRRSVADRDMNSEGFG